MVPLWTCGGHFGNTEEKKETHRVSRAKRVNFFLLFQRAWCARKGLGGKIGQPGVGQCGQSPLSRTEGDKIIGGRALLL